MSTPFNPLDPAMRADPYPTFRTLRRSDPVHEMAGGGYGLSRYADIRAALARPDLFSSAAMRGLIQNVDEVPDPDDSTETLLGSDPPAHTSLRKLVNRGFRPGRIAQLEANIRGIAQALAGRLADRDRFDLIGDFASPLTVRVIAELLGIDPDRHEDLRRWSDALILLATGAPTGAALERARAEKAELGDYLDEIIAQRRASPGDDLISALARAETEDGPLGQREVEFLPNLLLIAGNETTTHLIGNLMATLFEHPAQMALLEAHGELVPGAVEEGLRFESPVPLVLRTATTDVHLFERVIPRGSTVALLLASGNRDERVFRDADHFDVTRDAGGHLGFGYASHFCLGAALARLEARIALETLLPLGLRATGSSGRLVPSMLVRGRSELWVERETARQCAG